jgi:hypothetical protein
VKINVKIKMADSWPMLQDQGVHRAFGAIRYVEDARSCTLLVATKLNRSAHPVVAAIPLLEASLGRHRRNLP